MSKSDQFFLSLFSICDAPKASWRAETQRQNVASEANVASKIMWRESGLWRPKNVESDTALERGLLENMS